MLALFSTSGLRRWAFPTFTFTLGRSDFEDDVCAITKSTRTDQTDPQHVAADLELEITTRPDWPDVLGVKKPAKTATV